jgi:hypothetical protein
MASTDDLGTVRERSSGIVRAILKDETGAVLPDSVFATFTLTLYDVDSMTILNSRHGQNVLNANDVTIDGLGNFAWTVRPADHSVVSTKPRARERHRAIFHYTWGGGAKEDWHAFEFLVEAEPEVS